MGVFSTFFNPRKPREFSYRPRYFDPEQQKREERRARIIQEAKIEKGVDLSDDTNIPNIRGQFRAKKEGRSRIIHRRNVRLIMIFTVLLYLAYQLYQHL